MFRILYLGGVSKLIHYFDANGAQIFQNTLFRGVQNIHYYFDVQGAHIFQSTLFRGGANIHYYFDVRDFRHFKGLPPLRDCYFFAFFERV